MRDLIHRHNLLNGVVFSIVEFGSIAVLAGFFAGYYVCHQRLVMALISSGIAANCLCVVGIGMAEWRRRRRGGEILPSFWNKSARNQHQKDNPRMLRDAVALTVCTLVPFLSVAAVLFDTLISSQRPPTRP